MFFLLFIRSRNLCGSGLLRECWVGNLRIILFFRNLDLSFCWKVVIRNCRMLRGIFVMSVIHCIIGGESRSFSKRVFGVSGATGISMNGGLIAIHDLILLLL